MWNHWSDVTKKIRDIAAEITQPISEESESAQDEGRLLGRGTFGTCEVPHAAARTPRFPPANSDSFQKQGGNSLTSRPPGSAAPPVRRAAPSDVSMSPPSRLGTSTTHDSSSERNHPSVNSAAEKALQTPYEEGDTAPVPASQSPAGTRNGSEVHRSMEEGMAELELQVQRLSEEKRHIEQQVLAYQEEVTEAHRKTVGYYENKMATLQQSINLEKVLKEELAELLSQREKECNELRGDVQALQEQVEKLTQEAAMMKVAHDEVKQKLACREEECLSARQQFESLQEMHDALLERLERANKDKPPIAFVSTAHSAPHISHDITSAMAAGDITVVELRQRIEAMEEEKLIMVREKEQLAVLLQEERRNHRATVQETDQILSHDREQAQRLTELINQLENNRQQQRENDMTAGEERQWQGLSRHEEVKDEPVTKTEASAATGNESWETVISSLREEVAALKLQLDAAKQEGEEAARRVEVALDEKHAQALTLLGAQEERNAYGVVEELQQELKAAQQQACDADRQRERLQEEVQQLHNRLKEAQSHAEALSGKLTTAEARAEALQSSLQEARRATEGHEASLVSALTTRKKELEVSSARTAELMQQLEHTITDCLVRAGTDLPSHRDGTWASFSDKVTLLASEFNHIFCSNQKAAQLQKEWERTYEQARGVNATLSQQVSEAWKNIGNLREDLSLREQSIAKLKQQVQAESQQHLDVQHTLVGVTNELQVLKEEKKAWEARIGVSSSGEAAHQEQLAQLAADVETLRRTLQDRDEELSHAQRSLETLQQVLDTFTKNKTRDVEERTADMQIEIDQLRTQVLEAEERQHHHQEDIDAIIATHRREVAAKNLEITSLHRKHAELRKALDETARQLSGMTMIDKRVISHLTVNFIHAFVGHRREADEMLKVLGGLLNWDEEMQEKAGLLPGPSNPKPGHQGKRGGLIGGLVKSVWGGSGRTTAKGTGTSGTSPSIAELWVEFLMRESEAETTQAEVVPVDSSASQTEEVVVVEGKQQLR
ncbi:hypothetical protein TraAM80_06554 [Trypanosoma rangeli]|uniref:GRIP domain-containing protein n=1 Tax=Trypanosoma rangeli TaxID=5698 RepID=A0A422N9R7_TRYRA|nr:uncharacterized protein TraAM80_06554 [Trypanosoma rangeli]RNF02166.1 hypothetical protein TraAM80_06554 [Trypanosoma rangeli]|eukprot:RNF02166.1 hypothetical protein TraAM80_06554 [Trypanosoma rangeli]